MDEPAHYIVEVYAASRGNTAVICACGWRVEGPLASVASAVVGHVPVTPRR